MLAEDRTAPVAPGDAARRLDRANLAVLSAQVLVWALLLVAITRLDGPWWTAVAVAAFCLMMQGVFSMMHECFHGHGYGNPRVNASMCWLASTLFGASATLIKVNHLGHHVRNRTRAERVDYIDEDESRLAKTVAYYVAIAGGIWLGAALGSLVLALVPVSWLGWLRARAETNTYAAGLADFTDADFRRIRLEVLAGVAFWVAAWQLLGLTLGAVALAYGAFALSWSSLQWIYHLRTPLDVIEGTYNLRAPRLVRWCLLNFNYNLTHHRDPGMRWQAMHDATNLAETRPLWWTWLAILRPPEPLPADPHVGKTYY